MGDYPHTSWNSAETRALAHGTNVAGLDTQVPSRAGA